MTPTIKVFAPAKINLALHVTGQRADGYHLLDSYVMFADVGDVLRVTLDDKTSLTVSGPRAYGVPADRRNLCWKAAEFLGATARIELEKHLPSAAGIGGGSSDAAAVLKALCTLMDRPTPEDTLALGADVPVCMVGHASRMQGIGEHVLPLFTEHPVPAVLVNPGVEVSTPDVFRALATRENAQMTDWPEGGGIPAALAWLAEQRNDLEAPAIALEPVIGEVLEALRTLEGARLCRMSGSGATCFALFETRQQAQAASLELSARHPDWWSCETVLR